MFGTIINKNGIKVGFVVLDESKMPIYYELNEGEVVIEESWEIANSMNVPKWDGEKWVETEPLPPKEPIEPQPNEIDILKNDMTEMKEIQSQLQETQLTQSLIIDDLVFEVIPTLETQINPQLNAQEFFVKISSSVGGMATYLSQKIIDGKSYSEVFKVRVYNQYKQEVDRILNEKGYCHLIIN